MEKGKNFIKEKLKIKKRNLEIENQNNEIFKK